MWFIISRDFIHTFLVLSDAGHWSSSYISMPHTPYNNLKLIMGVVPIQLFTYMWDLKDKFNIVDHRENKREDISEIWSKKKRSVSLLSSNKTATGRWYR